MWRGLFAPVLTMRSSVWPGRGDGDRRGKGDAPSLCITLPDGLTVSGSAALNALRAALGDAVPIFGGTAGDQWRFKGTRQFNAYKKAFAAQQASQPGSQQAQPGQQLIQGQSLYPAMETAGPNHIEVQQFGGFGPMGTAALGDW